MRATSARPSAPAASSGASSGTQVERQPPAVDAIPRALASATITTLAPRGGDLASGVFDASLTIAGEPRSRPARLALALVDDPHAWKRPLAYERLSRALGARVVPVAASRRVGAGELAALLEKHRDALLVMKQRAAVQNDGTIDALLMTPGAGASPWSEPAAREIAVSGSAEIAAWARWALSPTPAPGERTSLLRDYIEMLALDYLSANMLRRTAFVDDAQGSLLLVDNTGAFPLHVDPGALNRILAMLRGSARFPRGLRDALARLDRARAAAALAPGEFSAWLVSPRSLIELDERRAGLLSLIEAKIAARAAAGDPDAERSVLCL